MSLLTAASVVLIVLAVVHSIVGEHLILRHLPTVSGFPEVFGNDAFVKRTLRVVWHVPSILGLGLAAMTWRYASLPALDAEERFVLESMSASLLACALLTFVGTRARHPGWLGFLAAGVLSCLAACRPAAVETPAHTTEGQKSVPNEQLASADIELHPELVTFPSGALTLHGWLWRPPGAGPFPTIVYNHGSESLPGWMPGEAAFFVRQHGFVLFVPHRRGQGRSADAGPYIDSVFEASGRDASALTDTLVTQTDDVMGAIAYAASLPYVDPKRIAVVGCSLGGVESLFAAERGTGIVAAVDFSGGAMTWATSPPLQDRMKLAARNAKVPVFFVQAENDFDTAPSLVLSDEMKRAGKPFRVHVFPPNGVTHEEGHSFCAGPNSTVWGEEVMAFLRGPMALH